MKKSIFLIAILFMTGCASHDPWTRKDTHRHAAMTGLMVIDWRQTTEASEKPNEYREINPILGEHPDKNEVDLYFAGSWLFKTGIAYYLPAKWRPWWQYVCIGASAGCVVNNYSIGLQGEW